VSKEFLLISAESVQVDKRIKIEVNAVKKVCQLVSLKISFNFYVGGVKKLQSSGSSSFFYSILGR